VPENISVGALCFLNMQGDKHLNRLIVTLAHAPRQVKKEQKARKFIQHVMESDDRALMQVLSWGVSTRHDSPI
jgi:hypothetical protein